MNELDRQADILFEQYKNAVAELRGLKFNTENFGTFGLNGNTGILDPKFQGNRDIEGVGNIFRNITRAAKSGLETVLINEVQKWVYANASNFARPWSYYFKELHSLMYAK